MSLSRTSRARAALLQARGWERWRLYVLAFVTIALVTGLKLPLRAVVGASDADLAYLAGVMFVGWLGGFGPAMIATALSVVSMSLFFLTPHFSFRIHNLDQLLIQGGMMVEGTIIAILCEAMRQAQRRATHSGNEARLHGGRLLQAQAALQSARDGLEGQVQERTAQLSSLLLEQQKTNQRLGEVHKMEALGRLAGGVAHDFNNLLTVINSYGEMLLEDLGPGPGEDVAKILDAGRRAASLTHQLLAFSRRQVVNPRPIDLTAALPQMSGLLRRLIGDRVSLDLHAPATVATVIVDPTQVEQVIVNLVVNARDAMPEGGAIKVEIDRVLLDAPAASGFVGIEPGPYVMLRVTDTGTGMDAATQLRIFEPFFTTKAHAGTGLGLATVFGIVHQSGGAIRVQSELGRGTTFELAFPATDSVPQADRPIDTAILHGCNELVLVVDDDEAVRGAAGAILRRSGYRVVEASNAGEALLLCEQHRERIDLLLTDVVMPHVSGPRLARRIRRAFPDTAVVFMSGYPDDDVLRESANDAPLLPKPFTPQSLSRAVRGALDAAQANVTVPGAVRPAAIAAWSSSKSHARLVRAVGQSVPPTA